MAGDYIFTDDVAPAAAAGPSRTEKILKWFILVASMILGAELIWLLGVTPFMPFSRIDISGDSGLARELVFAAGGIHGQSSFISLNARDAEKALMVLPQLESAKVFKHFPDRLEIILEGRKAAAISLANLDGRIVPVLFDKEGVIFRVGLDRENPNALSLPIVSGLVIEQPVPGMRLPAMFNAFLSSLEEIEFSAPELLAAVSEIRINRKSFDGFDLILYPVHNRISVRLSELDEESLRYTLLMVDVLAAQNGGIESIDFRSGIASYTIQANDRGIKEASSEQ
jgi:cell division protein FtsQ